MTRFHTIQNPNGTHTVEDTSMGEVMHSRIGPWEEAQALYIEGSELRARLLALPADRTLIVADVGMGIAANSWAAIETALAIPPQAGRTTPLLRMISFENALGGIRHAWAEARAGETNAFDWLKRVELAGAFPTLLDQARWTSPDDRILWELREGDFFAHLKATDSVDLFLWDFYAPKSCPDLWSIRAFRETWAASHARTRLHTYSAATATRSALILAGWYVGYGIGTTMKGETTIAAREAQAIARPLSADWLRKLRHSTRPFPLGDTEGCDTFARLESQILNSPHGQAFFTGANAFGIDPSSN